MNKLSSVNTHGGRKNVRRNRLLHELVHDTYQNKGKYVQNTVCPKCHACVVKGRWTWDKPETESARELCPACRRMQEKVPAAYLQLGGEFLREHYQELMNLVFKTERREKKKYPLKRIMSCDEHDGYVDLSLSDSHLARGIGEAILQAYGGELDYQYTKGDKMLRVSWCR